MCRRRMAAAIGACALIAAHILVGAPAASAHKHPTAVDLDSPGVVYVQTIAHVDVSLIEPDTPKPGQIRLTRNTYDPVLSAGSGFAVNPSGYIVTSAQTVTPDKRPAEIFAVNHLFAEHYSSAAPLPSDEYTQQHLAVGGRLDGLLQRCYRPNTTDANGGCVVRTTLRVVVYPFVTDQTKDGTLSAAVLTRHLTRSPAPEVAVLKIAANSMPTVKMTSFDVSKAAKSGTKEIPGAVLGFTGIPGAANPLTKVNTHVISQTATALSDDLKELVPLLTQGLRGGPIVADQQKIVGFYPWNVPPPGSAPGSTAENPPLPKLVDGAAILEVLEAVGVQALRGPTDIAFEDALHSFNNAEYAAALPALKRTLQLYGGHFMANADLTEALAKQGTAADLTGKGTTTSNPSLSSGGGGSRALVWVLAVVALAAALGLLALLMVRRRRGPADAAGAAVRTSPASVSGSAAAPSAAGVHPPKASGAAPARSGAADAARGVRPGAPAPRDPTAAGRPSAAPAGRPAARHKEPAVVGVRPSQVTEDPLTAEREPRAFCTSCGQRLAPNHQFCGWCGHRVG